MDLQSKYYVGNLLVAVKGLNDTLRHSREETRTEDFNTANEYGKQIEDNLNRLAKLLNVKLVEEG